MRIRGDETSCRSCHELYPASDLDRYLWCPACRKAVRRRSAFWGRIVGSAASLGVAAYLLIRVHPTARFLAFYLLLLALTYVLCRRIAVAVAQGYYRSRGGVRLPGRDARGTTSG